VRESWAPIRLGEAAAFHDKWFRERPMDYGADVREMIERGRAFSAIDYVKAQRLRHEITRTLLKTLDRYHAIISPTTPTAAVKIAEAQNPETYQRLTENTILYNLAGLPAVSIPIGLTERGLPVGAQIAGRTVRRKHSPPPSLPRPAENRRPETLKRDKCSRSTNKHLSPGLGEF
jgi:aspartyl-tRNA(Asn)/glutamyl-tRNA(Gln) amidotransferase subunit A